MDTLQLIKHHTSVSPNMLAKWFAMRQQDVYNDPDYQALVKTIDRDILHDTLGDARSAYEKGLPSLKTYIESRYTLNHEMMSPYTLANWVIGFLDSPSALHTLSSYHTEVPQKAIEEGLPEIVKMLDRMPAWQQALCVLAIPLLAK
jgi:hypothetical protein